MEGLSVWENVISLSSTGELLSAMGSARRIELSGFTLPRGPVLDALVAACRRGAEVTVRLDRDAANTSGSLAEHNAALATWLSHLGADAKTTPGVHLKAAVVDDALFLSDRNWAARTQTTMLRDTDTADVDAARCALSGGNARTASHLALNKAGALHQECELLQNAAAADGVDLESETFGKGSGIYGELRRLAQSGVRCRLLVSRNEERSNEKEVAALRTLAADGVDVRVGNVQEKFAVTGTARAWLGSANATTAYYDGTQLDWGTQTTDPTIIGSLEDHFASQWSHAKPIREPVLRRDPERAA
jgi:phosphatidylserine/phosphatidylglycerophosphate/cardiolipin synthase-like enzyme